MKSPQGKLFLPLFALTIAATNMFFLYVGFYLFMHGWEAVTEQAATFCTSGRYSSRVYCTDYYGVSAVWHGVTMLQFGIAAMLAPLAFVLSSLRPSAYWYIPLWLLLAGGTVTIVGKLFV
ncbi:hypothetical protein CAI21_07325 [Alkalilimnicola ehrlichii]|uniref:Uncharacterized protein n=1 Tax=Alkalilimnicola ehrlichii TaxID=351052 RepID=A0A3E0WZD4_9GAMM|nr:hypothetical protein [Alkalilimnicola ehrlichii]RFA30020.1 hypothetical protein CAI21_07325 [Alkalilimnicola ehrlichii]RFA37365.1 hypothetical protein CAL65_08660 [Alkalilimnicola ehrlichii]